MHCLDKTNKWDFRESCALGNSLQSKNTGWNNHTTAYYRLAQSSSVVFIKRMDLKLLKLTNPLSEINCFKEVPLARYLAQKKKKKTSAVPTHIH